MPFDECIDYCGCAKITYIFLFYDENKNFLTKYITYNKNEIVLNSTFQYDYQTKYLILEQYKKAKIYPQTYIIPTIIKKINI